MFFLGKKYRTLQSIQKKSPLEPIDTELLLAHVLQKPRSFVLSEPLYSLSLWQYFRFLMVQHRRAKGVPLAYLTGTKFFFGLEFLVNKYTLTPRPDTEILVEAVLSSVSQNPKTAFTLLDIGTGSGCIAIALKTHLQNTKKNNQHTFFASDISKKALKIANINAQKHKTNITFLQGDLLTPFLQYLKTNKQPLPKNLIITANLPYLTEEQFTTEKSIRYEPKSALVAPNNGLLYYQQLLDQIQLLTKNTYCTLFFEIDPSQTKKLTQDIITRFSNAKIHKEKDLAGYDRVIQIHLSKNT